MTAYTLGVLLAAGAASAAASSTTSVPTWLAVLAIVAPVLTGWVGALLAWLAATRTAERNASLARQDEQRRWNRERREAAYEAFLEARRRQLGSDRQGEHADPAEAWRRTHAALAAIEIYGSRAALLAANAFLIDPDDFPDDASHEDAVRDKVERSLDSDHFLRLIRKELGIDD